MSRFYFDIFDGDRLWTDDEGTEHATLEAARREAVETITSMAHESFPLDGPSSVSVDIRPETGGAVERVIVTLSFQTL